MNIKLATDSCSCWPTVPWSKCFASTARTHTHTYMHSHTHTLYLAPESMRKVNSALRCARCPVASRLVSIYCCHLVHVCLCACVRTCKCGNANLRSRSEEVKTSTHQKHLPGFPSHIQTSFNPTLDRSEDISVTGSEDLRSVCWMKRRNHHRWWRQNAKAHAQTYL